MEVGGWGAMLMPFLFIIMEFCFIYFKVQHMDVATIIG